MFEALNLFEMCQLSSPLHKGGKRAYHLYEYYCCYLQHFHCPMQERGKKKLVPIYSLGGSPVCRSGHGSVSKLCVKDGVKQ